MIPSGSKWYGSLQGAFKIGIGDRDIERIGEIEPPDVPNLDPSLKFYMDTRSVRYEKYIDIAIRHPEHGFRRIHQSELMYKHFFTNFNLKHDRYNIWIHPITRQPILREQLRYLKREEQDSLIVTSIMEKENYLVLSTADTRREFIDMFVFERIEGLWLVNPELDEDEEIMKEWRLYSQLVK